MSAHPEMATISALPPGGDPVPGTWDDEVDPELYRTELSGDPGGPGWRLLVDGVLVAQTDAEMAPPAAARWACRQMGEGVVFLNGFFGDPADSRYWVANPAGRIISGGTR
ncbi:MAG: hypothetical protein AB7N73_12235 [Gemmatimonadales bacterium]|jgi:hypothetical protein